MTESISEMCETAKHCFKCVVVIVNILLLVLGAGSMVTGILLLTTETSFLTRHADVTAGGDVTAGWASARGGMVAVAVGGGAVLLFAALGTLALLTANNCQLALYTVLLALLMVVEGVPIVLAVTFQSHWETRLDRDTGVALHAQYGGTLDRSQRDFTANFDALQADLQCCGWHNASDFTREGALWTPGAEVSSGVSSEVSLGVRASVPDSCCGFSGDSANTTEHAACVADPSSSRLYFNTGCREVVTNVLREHQLLVMALAGVTMGVELLVMVGTLALLVISVNNKYDLS